MPLRNIFSSTGFLMRRGIDAIKKDYGYFKAGVRDSIVNDPTAIAERNRAKQGAINAGLLDPAKEAKIKRDGGI